MFEIKGYSNVRKSDIGKIVEGFIDDNTNDFSVSQLELLEGLADEIEDAAVEIERDLDNLQQELKEIEKELEDLKNGD